MSSNLHCNRPKDVEWDGLHEWLDDWAIEHNLTAAAVKEFLLAGKKNTDLHKAIEIHLRDAALLADMFSPVLSGAQQRFLDCIEGNGGTLNVQFGVILPEETYLNRRTFETLRSFGILYEEKPRGGRDSEIRLTEKGRAYLRHRNQLDPSMGQALSTSTG